jgi:sirohydrochlorin cobaltochelatase
LTAGKRAAYPAGGEKHLAGEKRMPVAGAIILGHGTRRPETAAAFDRFVKLVADKLPQTLVRGAYIPPRTPGPDEAADALVEQGCRTIAILPYFLFNGIHTMQDIPAMAEKIQHRHPDIQVRVLQGLENDPLLVRLVCDRLNQNT